jgi:hypothetical protein
MILTQAPRDSRTMTISGNKSVSAVGRETNSAPRLLAIGRLTILIALTVVFFLPGRATAQELNEYEVKAAFLYNFAKFVEWPSKFSADPNAPMIIGILGRDPFGGEIDRAIERKSVNGHPLTIKRFSTLDGYQSCHILFVSSSERNNVPRILAAVANSSVLTVSETNRFAQVGGIINFITIENRIRFEINQAAAARAGLKISSKLLSLGRVVKT